MLVSDPAAVTLRTNEPVIVGDHAMQAEVDLSSVDARDAVTGFSNERLQRIYNWQNEINLSVLPLSAGEDTLVQIRTLLGKMATTRRVR